MILTDDRDIEFDFTDAKDGFVFDQMDSAQPKYHGISQMHRVDLIVDFEDYVLFVEIKDPSHPRAQQKGLEKLRKKLRDGTLGQTLADKFMDSFVYGWAEMKANKPIHYLSLITLDTGLLDNLTDEIASALPPMGCPVSRWKRALIQNCQVFNIDTWNENFPKWPVRRLSASSSA